MALQGFLADGEEVLASCEVKGGALYATSRRLCYCGRSKEQAFRDLLYSEVSSVALERRGDRGLLGWGITVAVVGALVALIFFPLGILGGWVLGVVVVALGLLLLGGYRASRRTRLMFAGQAMLKNRDWARGWRFVVVDRKQAKALIQTVRSRLQ